MASTKKDDFKNENMPQSSSPTISTTTGKSTSSFASSDYQQSTTESRGQQQQQQPFQNEEQYLQYFQVERSIDHTKENIRRSIDEAKREIPQYTQSVTEYHQQAMDSAEAITDTYLDSQREIINSTQQTWTNYLDTVYWWMSPRKLAEMYTRAVGNFADNSVSASRIWNKLVFANIDASKAYLVRTRESSKDISRINVNNVSTFERTSRQMRDGSRSH